MNTYEILKHHFGYHSFRYGQEELIDHILHKRDVLGIMPTGGGKSICYQLPSFMLDGITIVISPLIALMKDQVDSLQEHGIQATFLNSTLSNNETNQRIHAIEQGRYKLVYVAPERLLLDSFLYMSNTIHISFVAVDEAHCISQWGHDFRPSYKNIPRYIHALGTRPMIGAFTATATTYVIHEIKTLLELSNPYVHVSGFDRKNLLYKVVKPQQKERYLKRFIRDNYHHESGIIYCATRKTVESLAGKLEKQGFQVRAYHGGMSSDERTEAQEAFMMDTADIIVATNAFGMGIDKPDVRYVVHYNMPKNMEAYYQEAGRAGRDGKESECILIYSPADIVKQKLMITQSTTDPERERIQLENLQILVNYCHTNDCLRNEILQYFGEPKKFDNCKSCGNCNNHAEYVDMTVVSQKILSCIYRTGQRFGVGVIIQVLRGSKNKKIVDWNLDKVSTYGISTDYSEGGLREIIMNLIARGYIIMTADKYPVLKLHPSAREVLTGAQKILVRKERVEVKDKSTNTKRSKTRSKSSMVLQYDQNLLDQLLAKRKELATEKGVPLYVIFNNQSLEEMAHYLPRTREEFLEIKGVGEKKCETYGEIFMHIIRDFQK